MVPKEKKKIPRKTTQKSMISKLIGQKLMTYAPMVFSSAIQGIRNRRNDHCVNRYHV